MDDVPNRGFEPLNASSHIPDDLLKGYFFLFLNLSHLYLGTYFIFASMDSTLDNFARMDWQTSRVVSTGGTGCASMTSSICINQETN